MFTRSPAAPERAERPLAELRPGLPLLLVDETETLLRSARPEESPDVTGYIARIAMADALKKGEVHIEETRAAVEEEKRVFKEQLDKERLEHEQQIATERKEHERQVAEQSKQFAKEREDFERELAKERKELTRQREALAKERAAHAKDGEALARERESHAKDRALLLEERARHEQTKKEERERLAAEALALQAQAKLHAQAAAQKAVERKQVLADSKRANTEFKRAAAEFKRTVVSPAVEWRTGFPFSRLDASQHVVGLPNAERFPTYFSADVTAFKTFDLFGRKADLGLQLFNVTSHFNPRDVVAVVDSPRYGQFGSSFGITVAGYMQVRWQ